MKQLPVVSHHGAYTDTSLPLPHDHIQNTQQQHQAADAPRKTSTLSISNLDLTTDILILRTVFTMVLIKCNGFMFYPQFTALFEDRSVVEYLIILLTKAVGSVDSTVQHFVHSCTCDATFSVHMPQKAIPLCSCFYL